jgi:hypothetical protein
MESDMKRDPITRNPTDTDARAGVARVLAKSMGDPAMASQGSNASVRNAIPGNGKAMGAGPKSTRAAGNVAAAGPTSADGMGLRGGTGGDSFGRYLGFGDKLGTNPGIPAKQGAGTGPVNNLRPGSGGGANFTSSGSGKNWSNKKGGGRP